MPWSGRVCVFLVMLEQSVEVSLLESTPETYQWTASFWKRVPQRACEGQSLKEWIFMWITHCNSWECLRHPVQEFSVLSSEGSDCCHCHRQDARLHGFLISCHCSCVLMKWSPVVTWKIFYWWTWNYLFTANALGRKMDTTIKEKLGDSIKRCFSLLLCCCSELKPSQHYRNFCCKMSVVWVQSLMGSGSYSKSCHCMRHYCMLQASQKKVGNCAGWSTDILSDPQAALQK